MTLDFPYLTAIILLPLLGAGLIVAIPRLKDKAIRWLAAAFTFVAFALSVVVFLLFDKSALDLTQIRPQFEELVSWIPSIGVNYHLGVDGLGLTMLLLTTFLGFLAVLVSWKVSSRLREYFAWLLLLETSILGVFSALDLILFFIFWEVEIIPMYFLISIWGTGRKEYSATKYVIYTLFGSAFMLAGILTLYFTTGSMDMIALTQTNLAALKPVIPFTAIFFLLFAAFAIKLPVFPLHTWLPDAHTDAPTAVSVILAGALLKMGGYGMIRLSLSFFPEVARSYSPLLVTFAVINVLYGAAVTLRQTDLKRLIAYSSVSHMGYVLLGIFALTKLSLTGATLVMFSHGVITGLLFAMVGLVYEKTHFRDLGRLGGLARHMPVITVVFSVAGLASLGLPLTIGFAAEFLVFLGSYSSPAFQGIQVLTLLAVFGIVVTAGYILWMLQRVFYGPPQEHLAGARDADHLEKVPIFSLVLVIMLLGVYPRLLTDVIQSGITPIARLLGS